MSLKDQIDADIKQAMLNKQKDELRALRAIKSLILLAQTEKGNKEELNDDVEMGILVCGTGIGMSMVANRYEGIRAALCHEQFTAKMSREHNDANVLCLGARVVGPGLALEIVETWVNTDFAGGRHLRRIEMFSS